MCRFPLLFRKLLLQIAPAAAVCLRFLLLATAAVSRCRYRFSSYLLLLCWLAAYVAGLGDMVVFSSRVFNREFQKKRSESKQKKCARGGAHGGGFQDLEICEIDFAQGV